MADTSQSIVLQLSGAIQQSFSDLDLTTGQSCNVAVAYSGGVDSSVLLHLLSQLTQHSAVVLHAFHIHHGLSPHASQWLQHCEQVASTLSVPFIGRQVTLKAIADVGVEDAARSARYRALDDLCAEHHIQYLFMAHHLDDQIETMLLHLCRGSGLNGLVGMVPVSVSPLLAKSHVKVVRPWLNMAKKDILHCAQVLGIHHIEDESNGDIRYTRNTLRHQIVPVLKQYFPHIDQSLIRLSDHAASAQRLLKEVAETDAQTMVKDNALDIDAMRSINPDRQMNLLQYWLIQQDCRIASAAWMNELYDQLFNSKKDAQVCVSLGDAAIRSYEQFAYFVPNSTIKPLPDLPAAFQWQGEHELCFPQFGGKLVFDKVAKGIDAHWLQSQSLFLTQRTGGEVLKLSERRPSKSLKVWFQEKHIPVWKRSVLPLLKNAEQQIIFAADLGINLSSITPSTEAAVSIHWQAL